MSDKPRRAIPPLTAPPAALAALAFLAAALAAAPLDAQPGPGIFRQPPPAGVFADQPPMTEGESFLALSMYIRSVYDGPEEELLMRAQEEGGLTRDRAIFVFSRFCVAYDILTSTWADESELINETKATYGTPDCIPSPGELELVRARLPELWRALPYGD
jgi:hypothetical protein